MKSKELMVGNYIMFFPFWKGKVQFEKAVIITEIRTDYIVFEDFGSKVLISYTSPDINPIPLTPEILEKAGFKLSDSTKFLEAYHDAFTLTFEEGKGWDCLRIMGGSVYINYLHELQNLLFALTGEELNITL